MTTQISEGQTVAVFDAVVGDVQLSYVADRYHGYPGEDVRFYARVTLNSPLSTFKLQVSFPQGLLPGDTWSPDGRVPRLATDGETTWLVWTVDDLLEPGDYEYCVVAQVAPTTQDVVWSSRASVTGSSSDGRLISVSQSLAVSVLAKSRYLRYLPSIYQSDELMGRFLMLFESFWSPISKQIDQVSLYFDPRLAPPEWLPWLASWLGLVLNENWPLERRRLLIRSAAELYRRRGTRWALSRYLEIFTGETPVIVEHMAYNFQLGPEARLGLSIALGHENVPHTFTVILSLPPINAGTELESKRFEQERRQLIESIIETEKPAHTAYTLRIEPKVEP